MKTTFSAGSLRAGLSAIFVCVAITAVYGVASKALAEGDSAGATSGPVSDGEQTATPKSCHQQWVAYWGCIAGGGGGCDIPQCQELTPEENLLAMLEALTQFE